MSLFASRALKSEASVSFCASANAVTSGETVRVAPATKRITSLSLWTDSTIVRPHQPIPTMAARIIYALRISENFGSAPRLSATGSPSSLRTMLVPWTSATIL